MKRLIEVGKGKLLYPLGEKDRTLYMLLVTQEAIIPFRSRLGKIEIISPAEIPDEVMDEFGKCLLKEVGDDSQKERF